jgi:thiol:disulfide interchange protein
LFTYAIGMGVLFWVLAGFALSLPKSGRWMDAVKSIGGTGLLFAAVYYLKPFLPWMRTIASPQWWFLLVTIGVATIGVALGAIHLSFHAPWKERARKGVGIALLLAGALGAWMWKMTPKHRLPWVHDEQVAFDRARAEGKGVMVDFSAAWCNPCEELELTFGDDEVYKAITDKFVPLKFDVTANNDVNDERKARYDSITLPSVIFMAPDGSVLGRTRKMLEPDDFMKIVGSATKKLAAVAPTAPGLDWVADEAAAFERARKENKGVVVNVTAEWCGPCQELEHNLADAKVRDALIARYVPLRIDVTKGTDVTAALQERYKATTLPAVVFVSADGAVKGRVQRIMEPAELLEVVAK